MNKLSAGFWQFIFEHSANRKLRVVKPYDTSEYEATSLVWMAFKAFGLASLSHLVVLTQLLPSLQNRRKQSLTKMKGCWSWNDSSPFHYQCNKVSSYYKIVKKHTKVNCAKCLSGVSNTKCTSKMCKKCCTELELQLVLVGLTKRNRLIE